MSKLRRLLPFVLVFFLVTLTFTPYVSADDELEPPPEQEYSIDEPDEPDSDSEPDDITPPSDEDFDNGGDDDFDGEPDDIVPPPDEDFDEDNGDDDFDDEELDEEPDIPDQNTFPGRFKDFLVGLLKAALESFGIAPVYGITPDELYEHFPSLEQMMKRISDGQWREFLADKSLGDYLSDEQIEEFLSGTPLVDVLTDEQMEILLSWYHEHIQALQVGSSAPKTRHIKTAGDMQALYNNSGGVFKENWWKDNIILDNNINMGGVKMSPIGSSTESFKGTFDGQGHTISGLSIKSGRGLFGYTDGATIKNLTISGADIYAYNKGDVGGIIGSMKKGTLSDCNVTGSTVESNNKDRAGGAVGKNNDGVIKNVYVTGTKVNAIYASVVGGIAGENSGRVEYCVSRNCSIFTSSQIKAKTDSETGYVMYSYTGGESAGGLIGKNSGNVTRCFAHNDVHAGMSYAGGLIGNDSTGIIMECGSEGTVNIGRDAYKIQTQAQDGGNGGGLIGFAGGSLVVDCYSHCDVVGEGQDNVGFVGGLIGRLMENMSLFNMKGGMVQNCYATGQIRSGGAKISYAGGLIGDIYKSGVVSSYYDKNTSGMNDSGKGDGKSTADMKNINTYNGGHWVNIAESPDLSKTWVIKSGSGYPELVNTPQ